MTSFMNDSKKSRVFSLHILVPLVLQKVNLSLNAYIQQREGRIRMRRTRWHGCLLAYFSQIYHRQSKYLLEHETRVAFYHVVAITACLLDICLYLALAVYRNLSYIKFWAYFLFLHRQQKNDCPI